METTTKTKTRQPRRIRGLTIAEYHRLRRLIEAGEIADWAAAQAAGLCLPHRPRGRKRKPLGKPVAEGLGVVVAQGKKPRGRVASAKPRPAKPRGGRK